MVNLPAREDLLKWLWAEFKWRVLGRRYEVILAAEVKEQIKMMHPEERVVVEEAIESISRNPYSGSRLVDFMGEEELER